MWQLDEQGENPSEGKKLKCNFSIAGKKRLLRFELHNKTLYGSLTPRQQQLQWHPYLALFLPLTCDWLEYTPCHWLARILLCGSVWLTFFLSLFSEPVYEHQLADCEEKFAKYDKKCNGLESMTEPLMMPTFRGTALRRRHPRWRSFMMQHVWKSPHTFEVMQCDRNHKSTVLSTKMIWRC